MNVVRKHPVNRVFVLALLLTIGQVSCAPVRGPVLESTEPESVGLTWQECAISQGFDWRQAEDCFGHAMPLWGEGEEGRFGRRVGLENIQLTIGPDVYEASLKGGFLGKEKYTLHRNGKAIRTLYGDFSTYSPSISLQNLGGQAVEADQNHKLHAHEQHGSHLAQGHLRDEAGEQLSSTAGWR